MHSSVALQKLYRLFGGFGLSEFRFRVNGLIKKELIECIYR